MNIDKHCKVILRVGKDKSVERFHPWIFSGAIEKIENNPKNGDIVEVYNNQGKLIAIGHYQIGTIAVRIFSFQKAIIDYDFWKGKIISAYNFRKQIGLANNNSTNVYRLVNAEGDGMPGLIIDFYNGVAVLQTHSIGMHNLKDCFTKILLEIYSKDLNAVYDKSLGTLPKMANINIENKYLYKDSSIENIVIENGNKFYINFEEGQKTGFFIDQRENRKLLKQYVINKTVLNTFCYTGGFSIYALNAGAKLVHSVDSSKKAIELTDYNVKINGIESAKHESYVADAFNHLEHSKEEYDVIILDPPAFAKHNNATHNAIQGYKRLNAKAIEKIKPRGILFTFSCSQVISRDVFRKTVYSAALLSGRNVRILHHLSQPNDHPVNIYHQESEYLKGLVLSID